MITVSFPRSNANVRALLAGLVEHNLLESFHTTVNFEPQDLLVKMASPQLRGQLLRRSFGIPQQLIHTYPAAELLRIASERFNFPLMKRFQGGKAVDDTCSLLDAAVAKYLTTNKKSADSEPSAVYCYEDSALLSFRSAKDVGIQTFYELTIPYWQTVHKIVKTEAERRPEWAFTMMALSDDLDKTVRKTEELQLAETVICISEFVKRSIPAELAVNKRLVVVQYGAPVIPAANHNPERPPRVHTQGKLRALFVGGLSQQKGLADLFDAMKLLNRSDIELIVLGSLLAPMEFYRQVYPNFTYMAPRPHSEVLELMRTADVFVFPSLFEGRGMVQLEAMSCGLPVIASTNSTGEEFINSGQNGFIVDIAAPQAIADKLSWFADNRSCIAEMGILAQETARKWRWENYVRTIVAEISRDVL